MRLSEALQKFHADCVRRNLSFGTTKAYKLDLGQFIARLGDLDVEDVRREEIVAFLDSVREQKAKPSTLSRKGAVLNIFFAYLEDEGFVARSPVRRKDISVKAGRRLPRGLNKSDLDRLFHVAYKDLQVSSWKAGESDHDSGRGRVLRSEKFRRLRSVALLELLFATGARIGELLTLTVSDLDLKSGEVRLWGKGSKERIVQVTNPKTLAILRVFIGKRSAGESLFGIHYSAARALFVDWSEAVGRRVTAHMLRHTLATMLLDEGIDIRFIQQLLGHSSISVTEIYTHTSGARQRSVLGSLHPRRLVSC